ncbi:hypothetical protein ABIF65_008187 [Bradyrhizobium japonicum]
MEIVVIIIIVLLIVIAVRSGSGGRNKYARYYGARKCPHCGNKIPGEVSVCEFCHRDVPKLF